LAYAGPTEGPTEAAASLAYDRTKPAVEASQARSPANGT